MVYDRKAPVRSDAVPPQQQKGKSYRRWHQRAAPASRLHCLPCRSEAETPPALSAAEGSGVEGPVSSPLRITPRNLRHWQMGGPPCSRRPTGSQRK